LNEKTCRNFESVHYRKDGTEMLMDINAAPVVYKGRPAILSINRDITRRKQMEETIREMAYRDSLTGLPNRALFNDRLVQALAYARRRKHGVTLLYMDLDDFKPVNDTFGHRAGDELLHHIATRLTGLLRDSDTVARLGGDEFLILLPDAGKVREGKRLAAKIRSEIARPYRIGGRAISITASIGLAIHPRDGRSAKALMKRADAAMYAAKKSRRHED
jgi:diguanylate cyclase (GGDEF)-like protein